MSIRTCGFFSIAGKKGKSRLDSNFDSSFGKGSILGAPHLLPAAGSEYWIIPALINLLRTWAPAAIAITILAASAGMKDVYKRQVIIIYAVTNKYLLDVPVDEITRFEQDFFEFLDTKYPEVPGGIAQEKVISDENEERLKKALLEFKANWNLSLIHI